MSEMKGFEFVKVVLYGYPMLEEMADGVSAGAEVKAKLSFRSWEDTAALTEKIADEILLAERLRSLRALTESVLDGLSQEELFLLEYKYFRRKRLLRDNPCANMLCSERSYYRRQNAVFQKVCSRFAARGFTEETFLRRFGTFPAFMRALRAVKEGRAGSLVRRRKRRSVGFQKSETSCDSEDGRFPRMTRTAIATAAAHTAQITATCTAPKPPEASGFCSSGGGK